MSGPTSWLALGAIVAKDLKGPGADKVRGRNAVNEFCDWATQKGIAFPAPLELDINTLADFETGLEHHRTVSAVLNKAGQSAMQWAAELLRRSRHPAELLTSVNGAVEAAAKELPVTKKPKNVEPELEEDDDLDDDGDDDEGDDGDGEEEFAAEEEPPPPKRQRANRGQQQPIIVQLPPQRGNRGGNRAGVPPRSATSKLFARTAKVRFFKRDERGKRVMVEDYDLDDIGNMKLEDFAEQVVHPRFANEAGDTEYLVFEVNPATDEVKGHGTSFTIEGEGAPQSGADPFRTVHQAFDLMKQLKGEPDEAPKKDPALAALSQRAAAGGDMSQVLMVMMMEKLFNPPKSNSGDNELLLKLVDRLDRMEGKGRQPEGFGMAPPWYQPPLPPPAPMNGIADKMVELSMAKMLQPPPTLVDTARDMATLKQLFGGSEPSAEVNSLRAELNALRQQNNSRPKGGLEESVESFEKISTLVKTLSPTIGGEGGFAGFLKGMLTPEVGKAVAAAVAGASGQAPAAPPAAGAPQQPGPQAPVVTTPRDVTKPPSPIPQGVKDAAAAFQLGQTTPVRAERFADFIFAMYLSNDPYYMAMLEPVVGELGKPDVGIVQLMPARRLAMMLVAEQKPDWATPEFVDTCIAALAGKVGIPAPQALVDTRSRWTMDFRGQILMLDSVAVPVKLEVVATPEQVAAAATAPTPIPELAVAPQPEYPVAMPRAQPLSAPPPDRKLRAIEQEHDDDAVVVGAELAEQVVQNTDADVAVSEAQPEPVFIEQSIPEPAITARR